MALVSAVPPLSDHKSPYNFVLIIADFDIVAFSILYADKDEESSDMCSFFDPLSCLYSGIKFFYNDQVISLKIVKRSDPLSPFWKKAGSLLARGALPFSSHNKKTPSSHPLDHVENFAIYYGEPAEPALEQLKNKDLVIIEPLLFSIQQITSIRSAGTLTFGYLSVMESPSWNQGRMSSLIPSDYLLQANKDRIHFPEWDSYLMDLRQKHYRVLLLAEIQTSIQDKGLDGLFLDTVGDIDDYIYEPSVVIQMRQAYQELLQDIRRIFPNLLLIQNRGFDSLDYSASFIHGLLWEDWRGEWRQDLWMKKRVERLQMEQKRQLKVFSISLKRDTASEKEARKLHFIHASQPDGYNTCQ